MEDPEFDEIMSRYTPALKEHDPAWPRWDDSGTIVAEAEAVLRDHEAARWQNTIKRIGSIIFEAFAIAGASGAFGNATPASYAIMQALNEQA